MRRGGSGLGQRSQRPNFAMFFFGSPLACETVRAQGLALRNWAVIARLCEGAAQLARSLRR